MIGLEGDSTVFPMPNRCHLRYIQVRKLILCMWSLLFDSFIYNLLIYCFYMVNICVIYCII